MPGQVISKYLNNGFPGQYAEQGDHIVKTFSNTGDATLNFGAAVFGLSGGVAAVGSTGLTPSATNFKGVAIAQVKTANAYNPQALGGYTQNQPTPVIERGGVAVQVNNTAVNPPVIDGAVYVRVAGGTTTQPVGGFEAAADSTTPANTLQIANATWGSAADANGVALLVIKSRNNS